MTTQKGEREEALGMTPSQALAFFASVIKAGEPWTGTCQRAYDEASAALLSSAKAAGEMREWQPIETAPQGEDVLIAVFRDDFEDPIIQNSILIDGEEKGLYWSDWHGMPEPTHWMRYRRAALSSNSPDSTLKEVDHA